VARRVNCRQAAAGATKPVTASPRYSGRLCPGWTVRHGHVVGAGPDVISITTSASSVAVSVVSSLLPCCRRANKLTNTAHATNSHPKINSVALRAHV
jgi:hypothetical protein